ncbi:MAG TPA: DUF2771 family protein [Actinophytocola sp.]|uniref:DUF2771 family protein n=1 Tax=Actinophytocola sp. TaxID=1872138 RepID=UPI002DDD1AFB|nr:DUF2771 family protein [Actinophytocola sp.]HEV2783873.1 DUF2771 family protein [Actinophytocola sp.]
MHRIPIALAATALLLAACGDDPPPLPEVSFTAEGTTVSARPFLHCDVMVTKCDRDDAAQARMPVPPGKPVTVTVPREVADSPWSVVIQYRTATGEQKDPETVATFVPHERSDYTVQPPTPDAQLQTIEIKQASAKQEPGATSEIQLLARAVWSLQIEST